MIDKTKYNKRYKELDRSDNGPEYLKRDNLKKATADNGVRSLVRFTCGNLEEWNRYWVTEEERMCIFCGEGWDSMEHYLN